MKFLFDPRELVDFSELDYLRKHQPGLHVVSAYSWGVNADGEIIWVDPLQFNILHDEGEQFMLSACFDTDLTGYGAPPANMYIGLDARATPAEADTLATVAANGEPTTGGYARQAVSTTTGFTLSQPAAYYQATSTTVSFGPATGAGMGTVTNRFLTTHITAVTSGTGQRLIATVPLTSSRTINTGDTLNSNIIIGLSETA